MEKGLIQSTSHINILFVGHLSGYGGAEKSMSMLANGLSEKGYTVHLTSFGTNQKVYPLDERVAYTYIEDNSDNRILKALGRFYELFLIIRKLKPDVIICFWLEMGVFSALLSFRSFKIIISERGDPGDAEYKGLLGLVRYIAYKMVHGFVFQTEGAKNYFCEQIQRRSTVIHNPVYIKYNDFDVPKVREKVIVNVGRLHPQKNQELLINAFSKIANEFPDYKLEIYGDGELLAKLQEQILQLNLKDRIFLMGTTKNLWDKIVRSSLFVLSSDYEGMPNALMEAMALGLPCISADCPPGGPATLIENGKNGLLFPIKDEDKLVECLRKLLSNQEYAERLAINAKEICHTHSVSKIFNQWEKFIIKVVNGDKE